MQLPQPPVAGDDLRRDAQLIIPTDRFSVGCHLPGIRFRLGTRESLQYTQELLTNWLRRFSIDLEAQHAN
jgi:hypothetical protein